MSKNTTGATRFDLRCCSITLIIAVPGFLVVLGLWLNRPTSHIDVSIWRR